MRRFAQILQRTEGAEIAEAALVLPLVFMLLLGIVWFGRAFNIYSTIQQAAQQGAITAARASCATCGNTPATAATVDNVVSAVMQASSLDPTQIQASASPGLVACPSPPAPPGGACTATNQIWICSNVWLNSTYSTQPAQCGSVVSFQYPFQFYLPFTSLNLQQIVLSAEAQSRMEN
ncbi:MAG: TadE/TadG family type IV pilus assembly protein [Terriglobales bacterium]